jgi:hypothetical protein
MSYGPSQSGGPRDEESLGIAPPELRERGVTAPLEAAGEEGERYGVQWQNLGPLAGGFFVSWALTYALGDSSLPWGPRARAALWSSLLILLATMFAMRLLGRLVHHSRLASVQLFVVVWAIAFAVWWYFGRG